MIFVFISIFEMARGMWIYHSLAYAVKEGTRYASVHGATCTTSPNDCGVSFSNIATVMKKAGPALIPTPVDGDIYAFGWIGHHRYAGHPGEQ